MKVFLAWIKITIIYTFSIILFLSLCVLGTIALSYLAVSIINTVQKLTGWTEPTALLASLAILNITIISGILAAWEIINNRN